MLPSKRVTKGAPCAFEASISGTEKGTSLLVDETPADIAGKQPRGMTRRRMLRAAGADIDLSDFTDEERLARWLMDPLEKPGD